MSGHACIKQCVLVACTHLAELHTPQREEERQHLGGPFVPRLMLMSVSHQSASETRTDLLGREIVHQDLPELSLAIFE